MTGQTEPTITEDAINTLLEHGFAEGLPRIAEMILNAAMLVSFPSHGTVRNESVRVGITEPNQ